MKCATLAIDENPAAIETFQIEIKSIIPAMLIGILSRIILFFKVKK